MCYKFWAVETSAVATLGWPIPRDRHTYSRRIYGIHLLHEKLRWRLVCESKWAVFVLRQELPLHSEPETTWITASINLPSDDCTCGDGFFYLRWWRQVSPFVLQSLLSFFMNHQCVTNFEQRTRWLSEVRDESTSLSLWQRLTNRQANFTLLENNIHCSLSFRWRFQLFLMSFSFRPLPNFDSILAKEISSVPILAIAASTSAVQVILLGIPGYTGGLMMPDNSIR
jgi:hypothetical protein